MCRQIVGLHGGEISCTAGPDGCGTCIAVTLPARAVNDVAAAADAATYASSGARPV